MIKSTLKTGLFCLIAVALISGPSTINAQETNKHAEKKAAKEKSTKPATTPFHGKLKAVDATAKTITVGERTIQLSSETKLMKDGKPATLDEAMVGEMASGAYRKGDDGKLNATTVRFGAKPENSEGDMAKPKKSKKDK